MKNKLLLDELDIFGENENSIEIFGEAKNHSSKDIAIIGVGAKLPLADNIDEFWKNISEGEECIGELPETRRKDIDRYFAHRGESGKNIQYLDGAYLDEIDKFDYKFFRLTPIEANLMDPNQRLFLQTAWEAIEDSGYGGKKLTGSNTGVYVGYIGDTEGLKYAQFSSDLSNSVNVASVPGNLSSIIPSRISYLLDLKGPSMLIDTACSSSLLAVHLACQGIKNGDCDMAIAGGIRLNLVPVVNKEKLGMESSDGKTRSFDDRSDGTGMGEGVIAILLKPLQKALDDSDNIYAVIRGSSVNQDGTSIGITAPNVDAQADVIAKAWNDANIDPETISYIETHGTGTRLGDPIEIEGIKQAFSRYTDRKQFCAIGAVKANIGHLYQAAGIVGLLKVVLALKNKQIPPLVNFCTPNRKINFEQTPVYVNDRLSDWECGTLPRRAGVSSFGFSGTNCHIVLEEIEQISDCESLSAQVLTLSAKSESALMRLVQLHGRYIKKNDRVKLQDICYTANTGRGHYNYRLILKLKDIDDYRNKIERICQYGIQSANNFEDIFYGIHRIASGNEEPLNEYVITEVEKIHINETANEKLKEIITSEYKNECAMDEVCRLYIKGADVDWEELYKRQKVKKVSIPAYSFEKSRCWIEYSGELKNVQAGNDLYYSLVWKEDFLEENSIKTINGRIIIFMDSKGISKDLSEKICRLGAEVVEVQYGREFECISNYKYIIGINEEDHERLFKAVGIDNLSYIIHLSTIYEDVEINSNTEFDESQKLGVYSLFYITRALISSGLSKEIKMLLVSNYIDEVTGKEEKIIPQNSTFMGLGKVINREYINIKCNCLDVDSYFKTEDILSELTELTVPYHVAYREGKRYSQTFDAVDVKCLKENKIEFKEDGVYVITGGTGGLGLQVAMNLASKGKVKLALISRSVLPERNLWRSIIDKEKDSVRAKKLASLIVLESNGAQVEYYSTDISDYNMIKDVIDGLRKKHNRINGVIHCAGVAGNGFIIRKDIKDFEEVLAPKVKGTWNLDKLTENDALDFFIMFSSALSLAGELGQGDYTAANSYLDSFSYYRNKKGKKALTINWVAWKEIGMAYNNKLKENKFFASLSTGKAIEAFNEIINKDMSRVLIGELNCHSLTADQIEKIPFRLSDEAVKKLLTDEKGKFAEDKAGAKSERRVILKGKEHQDYSETEQVIGQVFRDVLGFEEINIYDNFFELGADSILLTKVHAKMEELFPAKVAVADFFAYPSIARLAKFIVDSGKVSKEFVSNKNQETTAARKDIAIIGMALKFPMAKSTDEFWNNLKSGKDCIRDYPESRTSDSLEYIQLAGIDKKNMSFAEGGYLDEIDKFDYSFFRLSPKEASFMDPNQRIFLQTVWNAIEDSGYGNRGLSGSKTGVFIGFSKGTFDYDRLISESDPLLVSSYIVGNLPSIIPGRVAYLLDLKGPTITVDTACSSSLVAVHMASQAIKNGECDMAIAGGVKINLLPLQKKGQSGIGIESTDCRARTFDDNSDGTGWGEGVAAVILKPLEKAVEDRDNIYAIIKGSAINQDGSSAGITAPNSLAQAEVIVNAWKDAGIDPETVTYIEAHGTGTKLGDPVEIDGVQRAFSRFTDKKQFCAIGSVKSNIGHMDTASGMAGLIKSVLALKNKQIPPSLHFEMPNRKINFAQSPVFVNDRLINWENGDIPLRCAVSSFGFSGTNCHVVLEEYKPDECIKNQECNGLSIFTLSAKSESVLREMVIQFKEFLKTNGNVNIEDVCHTLNTGRDHNNFRLALVIDSVKDLDYKLETLCENGLKKETEGIYFGSHKVAADNKGLFEAGEITEEQKRNLTLKAQRLIEGVVIDSQIDRSCLEEICRLYVNGADIEWRILYRDKKLSRISLPVYPFEKKRCWINIEKHRSTHKESDRIHPLIKGLAFESLGQKIYLTELSVDENWVLQDHKIMGKHVLPGTAYIEIARAAASNYYQDYCIELKDIIFVHPIVMESGELRKVHTVIRSQSDYIEFTITSQISPNGLETEGEWLIHAQGKVYRLNKIKTERNLEEIKQCCTERVEEINQNELTKGFIEFGPRWLNYHKLSSSESSALAELSLPDNFSEDLNSYYIHPALLDMAVNAVGLTLGEKYLPLTYKNFKLYGPTPTKIYSYLVKKYNETERLNETLSFDVTLMNEKGEVFAEIEGYSIKRANDFGKMLKLKDCFYKNEWIPQTTKSEKQEALEGTILLFKDGLGLGDQLALRLREQGVEVIEINYGTGFRKINDNSYTVGSSYESYQSLISELNGRNLRKVLHMFTLNNGKDYDNMSKLGEELDKGIYSLLNLAKGIVNGKLKDNVDILILSSYANEVTGEEEIILPHNAGLLGLSSVIKNEYFKLNCKRIDVDDQITCEDILYELKSERKNQKAAYRNGIRYVPQINQVNMEKIRANKVDIKENGVYIVTGGTGGIGLEVCKYLGKKAKVNLALISRSIFPDRSRWEEIINDRKDIKQIRTIKTLMDIESQGTNVVILAADVSDYDAMNKIVEDLREKYGRINGIIHGAGVAGEGFLYNKDVEKFNEVILPKIRGTRILFDLTKDGNLDFFVMFSSVASLFDLPGQGDYIAGNSYLDSFCSYGKRKGINSLTINWPAWKETGMAVNSDANSDTVFKAIYTNQAMDAFEYSLNKDINRVIIGELDFNFINSLKEIPVSFSEALENKRIRLKSEYPDNDKVHKNVEVNLKGKGEESYSQIEVRLSKMWAEVLGLDEINVYESFYELGGDSILATRLLQEVEREYPGILDITDVFSYSSISKMAEFIEKKVKSEDVSEKEISIAVQDESENVNDILNKLADGDISVDEVEGLIKWGKKS